MTTTAAQPWIDELDRVRPGDRIEAWEQERLQFVGTVGQVAPRLGILWILETGTGRRKLLPVHGYRIRPAARPA